MANTIAAIKQTIMDTAAADGTLAALTSTSDVAIFDLWAENTATAINALEVLFDFHKEEVIEALDTLKAHKLAWYVTMAKLYQHGDGLATEKDYYAVIDPTKQIIKSAAAVEIDGKLRIKLAKMVSGSLAPLNPVGELPGAEAYLNKIKDAGVRLLVTSSDPDDFRLHLTVYFDPLVIDGTTGERLDGTNATPVESGVTYFLENLPFNGLFVLNELIVHLQQNVEGVRIGAVDYCAARYGVLPYADIDVEYVPDAGYMVLDSADFNASISYVAHGPIK